MKEYERLKQLRKERNLKIADIARLLSATEKQVEMWENGEKPMSTHNYVKLAKFYNLRVDYIIGLIDTPTKLI